jgi:hypothetical protein
MFISPPFTEIEVGELDYFGFDFTPDLGSATITATNWTCSLVAGAITDPDPQSHIVSFSVYTEIATGVDASATSSPSPGLLYGGFSVALVGGFTAASIGGTYILEASVNLSDGRILKANSTVACAAPGA